MSRVFSTLLALALVASFAPAESRAARLAKAHEKLNENDAAGAIEVLRELQVEQPNDERVLYALGCAQYKLAASSGGVPAVADPKALYKEAQTVFESLTSAKDPEIARHAAFDRANCLAQAAKLGIDDPKNAQSAIGALRAAATAYDDYLRSYPGDKNAEQNRDHVRYLLKQLQRQKKDEKQDEQEEQKKDEKKQPPAPLAVRNAQTEIPGAKAVVGEDSTVQLVLPGAQGAQP